MPGVTGLQLMTGRFYCAKYIWYLIFIPILLFGINPLGMILVQMSSYLPFFFPPKCTSFVDSLTINRRLVQTGNTLVAGLGWKARFSPPAPAGSLRLCLCHQTPAWFQTRWRSGNGGYVHQPATFQCWHGLCRLGRNGIATHLWLKNLGPFGGIILNNFGSCRSRTGSGTQSYTSAHAQQKDANPLRSHKFPRSLEGRLGCLPARFLERRPCTRPLRQRTTSPRGREKEGTPAPAPCTAAHSCTQAPESTANLRAKSSAMEFGAEGKLGIKVAENTWE